MTILQDKDVKIHKPHRCLFCGRRFEPGALMHYQMNVDGGDVSSVYWCITCDNIKNIVRVDIDEEGYPEGYVSEMLEKGQTPEELLSELNQKK